MHLCSLWQRNAVHPVRNDPFRERDYLIIPKGTIYRLVFDDTPEGEERPRIMVIENRKRISYRAATALHFKADQPVPRTRRIANVTCDPEFPLTFDESGSSKCIKARHRVHKYIYDHHPLDVVGWDGCYYPYAFNIDDFSPIVGKHHMPPPTHQTFEAHNFVICSFCPRPLDFHEEAIKVPYNHSNLDSDEVLYYVAGDYKARKGIEVGSLTAHPQGIPMAPTRAPWKNPRCHPHQRTGGDVRHLPAPFPHQMRWNWMTRSTHPHGKAAPPRPLGPTDPTDRLTPEPANNAGPQRFI